MIDRLLKVHFKAIRAQMEREEEGRITVKSISKLMDMPVYSLFMTVLKNFCHFERYLSQRYGVEGVPLDYVLHPILAATILVAFVRQEECHLLLLV